MKHEIYNKIFYERLSSNKKYSILHGVGVYGVRGGAAKYHIINNTVVYLFSEREREFYKKFFSIDSELLRQYGIPKHEKKWINYILTQECKDDKLIPFDNYIFIISRPSGRSVPYDRKIEYIHDIKLIAKKYNYKIIVKKHPRGAEDGSFEQILGSDEYGVFWAYSNAHAYLLGAHCSLSISFYSGVPVDLIALGVPTIERLDLNDLPGYKEHKLTMSGIPVTEQRYFGLVLGASNYNQLEEHVKDIISNKSKIVNKLKNNYNKLYPQIKDINRVISKEIISSDTVIPKKNNT